MRPLRRSGTARPSPGSGDTGLPLTDDVCAMWVTLPGRGSTRCSDEHGFTMIELLVVLVVIGILVAIAVPSGLGFKSRAHNTTAKANIREARPAIEAYFAENDGTATDADLDAATSGYEGMTVVLLQSIES